MNRGIDRIMPVVAGIVAVAIIAIFVIAATGDREPLPPGCSRERYRDGSYPVMVGKVMVMQPRYRYETVCIATPTVGTPAAIMEPGRGIATRDA